MNPGGNNNVNVAVGADVGGFQAGMGAAADSALIAQAAMAKLAAAMADFATVAAPAAEAMAATGEAAAAAGAGMEAEAASSNGLIAALERLGTMAKEAGASVSGGMDAMEAGVSGVMVKMGLLTGPGPNAPMGLLNSFGGAIEGAVGKVGAFVSSMGSMVLGFASLGVIEDVIGEVRNFTDALMELNIQTEKNQFSWRYLYGGGNTTEGAAVAQGIADWTKKFSMQIPYTRQDLLNAISGMAPMGLSAQGLEHYMPMVADLAATRDPNANLAQVAQVIMSASMGYTRMLKYDLKINPEDLIQYGLDATGSGIGLHINDPSTLLPALENYSKAKHLSGAAKDISTQTWWGAWSSFMDRIQNFELDSGSGLFGSLKTNLNELSTWIDQHQGQINQFAAMFSDTLANAIKTASSALGDFLTGAGSTGVFDFLPGVHSTPPPPTTDATQATANARFAALHHGTKAGKQASAQAVAYASPSHITDNTATVMPQAPDPTPWQKVGEAVGNILTALGGAKDTFMQFAGFLNTLGGAFPTGLLQSIGDNLKTIGNSLTPQDKELLKDVGVALLVIVSAPIVGGFFVLAGAIAAVAWWMQTAVPWTLNLEAAIRNGLGRALGWIGDRIGDAISRLGDFKDQLGKWKDQLGTWFIDLGVQFYTWGYNMLGSFIKGMEDKFPWIKGIVDQIANLFHLHFPNPNGGGSGVSGGGHNQKMSLGLNGGYAPAPQTQITTLSFTINGSSTLEVQKLIDTTIANHGANIAQRKPNRGAYNFGTYGYK